MDEWTLTMTALSTEGWSPRNLTIQVRTLAVVSRAAKMTLMTLLAIWASVSASRSSLSHTERPGVPCSGNFVPGRGTGTTRNASRNV